VLIKREKGHLKSENKQLQKLPIIPVNKVSGILYPASCIPFIPRFYNFPEKDKKNLSKIS